MKARHDEFILESIALHNDELILSLAAIMRLQLKNKRGTFFLFCFTQALTKLAYVTSLEFDYACFQAQIKIFWALEELWNTFSRWSNRRYPEDLLWTTPEPEEEGDTRCRKERKAVQVWASNAIKWSAPGYWMTWREIHK